MVKTSKSSENVEESVADSSAIETDNSKENEVTVPINPKVGEVPLKGMPAGRFSKLKHFGAAYWTKKKWTLPATVLIIVLIVLAIPFTRYVSLGLFLKKPVAITITDSTTHTAISNAMITADGRTFYTNAEGKVNPELKLGNTTLQISKQYYRAATQKLTVTLSTTHNKLAVNLAAVGRRVPVVVTNKITGKPLAGAELKVLNTTAKTNKDGKATIVLPTTATTQKIAISLNGYNSLSATVQITSSDITANHFSVTPGGTLYFLSNQTGKIDVVKTNLDGTDRQTVLAGTGTEDPNNTSLLASRDWKYLALLSQRTAGHTSVTLIDTSNDKTTSIDDADNTAARFTFVGWDNDSFVYQVDRDTVQFWQSGREALKSYNADTNKLYVVDQTQGEGTSSYDYGYNQFSLVYLIDGNLVYVKNWQANNGNGTNHLDGKSVSLISAKVDGSSKTSIKDFPIPASTNQYYYYSYYVNLQLYEPNGLYLQVPVGDGTNSNTYYEYEDSAVKQTSDVNDATFSQGDYPTYLQSPSGKSTLWSDLRDGKNALFIGDDDAKNQKQVASLSEYTPYGWYSDNYLLVTKSSSELYIMPTDGSTAPMKVSDYYKPPLTYRGYGGGYGGQ